MTPAVDSIDEKKLIADVECGMKMLEDAVAANNIVEDKDNAVYIALGNTGCIGRLAYTHVIGDPQDVYTLTLGAMMSGRDDLHMTYDFTGTKEAFCRYAREKAYDSERFAKFIISCVHDILDEN